MLISGYRKGLFKVLDAVCILAALSITGWFMLPADLSVLDDYTGASLFTVVSYLFFFYVLDAYNVGAEDFIPRFSQADAPHHVGTSHGVALHLPESFFRKDRDFHVHAVGFARHIGSENAVNLLLLLR